MKALSKSYEIEKNRIGTTSKERRWEQDGMDVEEMRTACWEVELTEGEDDTDDMETETD